MSFVIVVSTVVSLVVPVDVIGNGDFDAALVVIKLAALVVVAVCVLLSALVLELEVVADVTAVLLFDASGDVVGADETVADSVVTVVADIAVLPVCEEVPSVVVVLTADFVVASCEVVTALGLDLAAVVVTTLLLVEASGDDGDE